MTSQLVGFYGLGPINTTVYAGLSFQDLIAKSATENIRDQIVSSAGTLKNLRIKATVAAGASQTIVVTLRKNGAGTALTATLSGTDTTVSDLVNTVTVAAGDLVCWELVGSAAAAATALRISAEYVGDTANESLLMGNANLTDTDAYLVCSGDDGGASNAYAQVRQTIATAGTIKKLYIKSNTAPGAGKSRIYTVYKNGVATALTATIAEAATTANDTTNSFTVVAGDDIAIFQDGVSAPTLSTQRWGMTFVATTDTEFPIIGGSNSDPSTAAARYQPFLAGESGSFQTTETNFNTSSAITIKNLYVKVTTAPAAGKSWAIAVRVNSVDSAIVATISDANTTANSSGTVSVAALDNLSISTTPTGTPTTVGEISWGINATFPAAAAATSPNLLLLGVG